MAAVTLGMVAKLMKDPLHKGIIMNLLRESPIMDMVPFENVGSIESIALRWTNLPTVAFRRINADYTPSHGDTEQVYESVYAFGGTIREDRVWKKLTNLIQDPHELQIKMKTKAMALTFSHYFLNGDHGTDPDGFEGLKKRIDNGPSRQKIRFSSTTDVLDPTASAANARRFLDKLLEGIEYANGGQVNAILCNVGVKLGLGKVLRYLGASGGPLLDVTKDQFDRRVYTIDGIPLIDAGLKADQTTEIIPSNETAEDAGTDATSMYLVPFNMEQGIHGIQLDNIEIEDGLPTMSTNITTLIEWWCGLAGFGSYGPVRLHNLEAPASWT